MLTITIHALSFAVGMIFGAFITLAAYAKFFYDERWSDGYGAGFRSGAKMKEAKKCGD